MPGDGGLYQLVTRGIENVYLDAQPEITLWKTIYRRHTEFSLFDKPLYFNSTVDFNKSGVCKVNLHADLLLNLILVLEVSAVDIFYRNKTPAEVALYLAKFGITWVPTGDTFSDDDVTNIKNLINARLTVYTSQIAAIDSIISTDGYLSEFSTDIVLNGDDTIGVYIDNIVEKLIDESNDDVEAIYKVFSSYVDDTSNPTVLTNLHKILTATREELQDKIVMSHIVNGSLKFYKFDNSENTDIKESYDECPKIFTDLHNLFITFYDDTQYNTSVLSLINNLAATMVNSETTAPTISSDVISAIMTSIESTYNSLTSNNTFSVRERTQLKRRVIDTIFYNVMQNVLSMRNFIKALNISIDVAHVKVFTTDFGQSYSGAGSFTQYKTNVSAFDTFIQDVPRGGVEVTSSGIDPFAYDPYYYNPYLPADYLLGDIPGEGETISDDTLFNLLSTIPSYVSVYYETIKKDALKEYYKVHDNIFATPKLDPYFKDYTFWENIDVNNSNISSYLSDDTKGDMSKIFYMNLIPLFSMKTVGAAIKTMMAAKGTEPLAMTALTALNTSIDDIYNTYSQQLGPAIDMSVPINETTYVKNIYKTAIGQDNETGLSLDKVLLSSFGKKFTVQIDGVGPKYDPMTFVKTVYKAKTIAILTTYNAAAEDNSEVAQSVVDSLIDAFFLDISSIPEYDTYKADSYKVTVEGISIEYDSIISSIYNYIASEQISAFNTMYTTLSTSLSKFPMLYQPFDHILEDILFFAGGNRDYYHFDVQSNAPSGGVTMLTAVENFTGEFVVNLSTYALTFINNMDLLTSEYIPISQKNKYFITFDTIWTEMLAYINKELRYDSSFVDFDVIKGLVNQNTVDTAVARVKTFFADVINGIDNETKPYNTNNFNTVWASYVSPTYDYSIILPPTALPDTINAANIISAFNTAVDALVTQDALYTDIGNIKKYYNDFDDDDDVFNYIRDALYSKVGDYSFIYTLFAESKRSTYSKIIEYYEQQKSSTQSKYTELNTYLSGVDENIRKKGRAKFAWVENLAYTMIEKIKLEIGGQELDEQDGLYMYINNELCSRDKLKNGHNKMIGNIPCMTSYNTIKKGRYTMFVPLQLYINKKRAGNALPLVALNHSDIMIHLKLAPFESCAYWDTAVPTYFKKKVHAKAHIMGEFVYVGGEERVQLASTSLQYIIEQTKHINGVITKKDLIDGKMIKIELPFRNICKEVMWMFRYENLKSGDKLLPFILTPRYSNAKDIGIEKKRELTRVKAILDKSSGDHITQIRKVYENTDDGWFFKGEVPLTDNRFIKRARILLNSTPREQFKDADFYNYFEPARKHSRVPPAGLYNYCFSDDPEVLQPRGGINAGYFLFEIEAELNDEVITTLNDGGSLIYDAYGKEYNQQRIMSGMSGLVFNE